ncbi:hypothetical protein [Lentzea californiensis]|uniref:hypothetical protein n=1 Tax=Lentzea californiensis TaxID=438851 RepID=UPI0021642A65|nr:hypothetical protein [Lentzea californiensis]MCR3746064.1 hypothetical protein [Lentzea californiensis]
MRPSDQPEAEGTSVVVEIVIISVVGAIASAAAAIAKHRYDYKKTCVLAEKADSENIAEIARAVFPTAAPQTRVTRQNRSDKASATSRKQAPREAIEDDRGKSGLSPNG